MMVNFKTIFFFLLNVEFKFCNVQGVLRAKFKDKFG